MKTIDEGLAVVAAETKKLEDENAKYKDLIKKLSAKNKELEENLLEFAQLKTKFAQLKDGLKVLNGTVEQQ